MDALAPGRGPDVRFPRDHAKIASPGAPSSRHPPDARGRAHKKTIDTHSTSWYSCQQGGSRSTRLISAQAFLRGVDSAQAFLRGVDSAQAFLRGVDSAQAHLRGVDSAQAHLRASIAEQWSPRRFEELPTTRSFMFTQKDLDKLRHELTGPLLQPGSTGYAAATTIDNGRIRLQPGVVVLAATTRDVVCALRFAKEHDAKFTVRSGGHSAAGYCLNEGGVVLDMTGMRGKTFNARNGTLHAQIGNTWSDLYVYLTNTGTGLIPVGGGCPTVGIPGFMLGGGVSFVSRSYGLSVDNLISIDIVTPDGEVRRLSAASSSKEDLDLFWACRGGCGGNFGVVIAFEIQLHKPHTDKMLVGQIRYPIEIAEELLGFYNEWIQKAPRELAVYGYMGNAVNPAQPQQGFKSIGLTPIFNGDTAQGMDLIAPILRFKNISISLYEMTLPDFELMNGSVTLVKGRQAYIRSAFLRPEGFNPQVAKILPDFMRRAPSADSLMVWSHCGGKIGDVPRDETAFWHREAPFLWELKAIWKNDYEMVDNVDWAYAFGDALEDHMSGAYANYIDPLLHDWQTKYYGDNYAKLCEVKKQCDPTNFFRFQQSIGSDFQPSTNQPLDLSPLFRTYADQPRMGARA
ncbi:FAD-binding oxidoreductase [Sorangium sp. So ce388]|uniref:FAD-binding oxidoreductase n=1 Tax=Sorangium sp. So ce388 TaxID=3133309 RepID=UPI003F5C9C83